MEMSNIDRTLMDRTPFLPVSVETGAPETDRVEEVVAPVKPTEPAAAPAEPGVVNAINPAVHAQVVGAVGQPEQAQNQAQPQSDPSKGSQGDHAAKEWTMRKEEAVQPAQQPEPPKEPLSKVLMEHISAIWGASARVVEIWMQNNPAQSPVANQQAQTQVQATNRHVDPLAAPGDISKEVLTYSPTEIKKVE